MTKALPKIERNGNHRVCDMPDLAQKILFNPNNPARLTPCEAECVPFMLSGACAKEISYALDKSERTVDTFMMRIYEKLGVHNALDFARGCLFHGYVSLEEFVKPYQREHPVTLTREGYRIWRKK